MRTGGELLTCDLCGETAFKLTGQVDPKGWNAGNKCGLLCPNCYAEYIDILEQFKRRKTTDTKVRTRLSDADSLRREINYVQST